VSSEGSLAGELEYLGPECLITMAPAGTRSSRSVDVVDHARVRLLVAVAALGVVEIHAGEQTVPVVVESPQRPGSLLGSDDTLPTLTRCPDQGW
jgi:hypothetical protein